MQHTTKRKNPTAYAILALFTGPISLLFINRWMGLFVLSMPIVFCTLVDFYFLDGNLNVLSHYVPSLSVWAGAYWVSCIAMAYKAANWHNKYVSYLRNMTSGKKELIPQEMKQWLLENPEATVNDYYAIVVNNKFNLQTPDTQSPGSKVYYQLATN